MTQLEQDYIDDLKKRIGKRRGTLSDVDFVNVIKNKKIFNAKFRCAAIFMKESNLSLSEIDILLKDGYEQVRFSCLLRLVKNELKSLADVLTTKQIEKLLKEKSDRIPKSIASQEKIEFTEKQIEDGLQEVSAARGFLSNKALKLTKKQILKSLMHRDETVRYICIMREDFKEIGMPREAFEFGLKNALNSQVKTIYKTMGEQWIATYENNELKSEWSMPSVEKVKRAL